MATSVTMPRLGESVTEGTVTRWLKSEGDHVDADEPLLEVSTDKVDTEVPSPASGTLLSIKVQEDETVEIGVELAVIGEAGESDGGSDGGSRRLRRELGGKLRQLRRGRTGAAGTRAGTRAQSRNPSPNQNQSPNQSPNPSQSPSRSPSRPRRHRHRQLRARPGTRCSAAAEAGPRRRGRPRAARSATMTTRSRAPT